jgi:lysophospholipid acyltransferase (LPLAT)-like uncharacterized protein
MENAPAERAGSLLQPVNAGPEGQSSGQTRALQRAYEFADLSAYPFRKRLAIRSAGIVFYALIALLGRLTRFEVEGGEILEGADRDGLLPIYTFWHNRVFLGTYFFRKRGIVIMTSRSFDGEYIARFIQRFGYGAARGSSSRGGVGAIVEMVRLMRAGKPAGFSIDGPRGPRYVAKMGAVMLAKKTGNPIVPLNLTPQRFWQAKSWDAFQVPKPFTRTLVGFSDLIYVPADAGEEELAAKNQELQSALDALVSRGEEWRNRNS